MRRALVSVWVMLAGAMPAIAQDLVPSPELAPDIAALPRLVGDGAAIQRINDQLGLLDERDFERVNCGDDRRAVDPFRSVEVLADGPEFLSFKINTGAYCDGAAHYWSSQRIANFDLETSEETDLRKFLPLSWQDPEASLFVLFINSVGDLPGDCLQTYTGALRDELASFDLGLVEADATLVISPFGLPYVESPCIMAAAVPVERLEETGFDRRLIEALTPRP